MCMNLLFYPQRLLMRTDIDIDDDLMRDALRAGDFKTKQEAVEASLRLFIRTCGHSCIRRFRGELEWEGSLEQMRRDQ